MSKPIRIIARYLARPGADDALHALLRSCIKPSRCEAGNLHYELFQDVENEHIFVLYEAWHDKSALENHACQSYYAKSMQVSMPLLATEPEVVQF